jgi:hypothetical protein
MAIDIEETKQLPQPAKEMVEMVKVSTEAVVHTSEPFIDFSNIDTSIVLLAILAVILIKPIFTIIKYALALGLIVYMVKYFALS